MKVIIAGSRSITNRDIVAKAIIDSRFVITEIVSGCAHGVDKLGETFASMLGVNIARFPANWDRFGKYAGIERNKRMAEYADALIAVWDGKSRGTKNMLEHAKSLGLHIHEEIVQ